MEAKANLLNSVVLLIAQRCIRRISKAKLALDIILNEFISHRMWSTQHLHFESDCVTNDHKY